MTPEGKPGLEPIQVTARFDTGGHITPVDFTRQGQTYPVTAVGRRWEDGEELHVLVMAPGDRVFELVYSRATGRWWLGMTGRLPGVV